MKALALIRFAVLIVASSVASQVWAHGGGGMGGITEGDTCSREKGYHVVHFSAYQRVSAGAASQLAQIKELKDADLKRYVDALKEEFQSYCRDIPSTGKVTLTFDLISDALRTTPMAVKVVEMTNSGESGTVLDIPQQVYPSGVVRAEAEFAKAGKYTAIVEVQEHADQRARPEDTGEAAGHRHDGGGVEEAHHAYDLTFSFPFTVGLKTTRAGSRTSMMSNPAILATTIAGMGIGTALYVRRRKKAA